MAWVGLALLPTIWLGLILTGLPAFVVLIGAGLLGGAVSAWFGGTAALLSALPSRLVNLLENDLLQALPLFVLMGALLNRLPLADRLFRTATAFGPRGPAGAKVAAIGLAALLAPLNGSVGASVSVLNRVVRPRLAERGVPPDEGQAVVALASTLGVVIPPSLVLILLGDAMMGAHTVASNLAGRSERIVNTQDIFRGVLPCALLLVAACLALAARRGRGDVVSAGARAAWPGAAGIVVSVATVAFIVALMGGVAWGYLNAVEAGAVGAMTLLGGGLATRQLDRDSLAALLADALVVTGALFALLIAATTFTLVLRALGADRLIEDWIAAIPGGATGATLAVLAVIAASALVMDAFEIIFVVVPIVMPALLVRVDDAVWVAVLTLLTLQISFLVPPLGFAVMMARDATGVAGSGRRMMAALAPFLAAQALVLAVTFAWPPLTRVLTPKASSSAPARTGEEIGREFQRIAPDLPEPPRF